MTKTDALPDRKAGALDTILTRRLNIAAFGEQDAIGWWDSYALGDVGEYALGRLFPRTAQWATLELRCEAARRRQQRLLEWIPGALHLFDLGSQAESLLRTRILPYKAGELTGTFPMAVHTRPHSADDLDAALRRRRPARPRPRRRRRAQRPLPARRAVYAAGPAGARVVTTIAESSSTARHYTANISKGSALVPEMIALLREWEPHLSGDRE
jgi:hypothetical protein